MTMQTVLSYCIISIMYTLDVQGVPLTYYDSLDGRVCPTAFYELYKLEDMVQHVSYCQSVLVATITRLSNHGVLVSGILKNVF